ncbi:MAG: tRNA (N6-threonylcarbamoyladenosine(37)-N6)-methyltransferase TrmO [Methanothrix sp.]|jgi:tRNA-Thr(GGU) m(6)t(6)A37 methyltransferase TsaA|nr:tRNA (N6-threonylcarbamoyladenosine(37)-N6)-methyltransferase TrmO [Methanothrix sp.]
MRSAILANRDSDTPVLAGVRCQMDMEVSSPKRRKAQLHNLGDQTNEDMSPQMDPEKVVYSPIGVVSNRFNNSVDPKTMRNAVAVLILNQKCKGALEGLDRFRYLLIVYHIDRSPGYSERVHPTGDKSIPMRGVLATRSPCRPNPIGVTVAEILSVDGNKIRVTGLDALNKTPILDIKPYEEHFDSPAGIVRERDPNYSPCNGPR